MKSEEAYTKALTDWSKLFDQKFEKSFGLKEKGIFSVTASFLTVHQYRRFIFNKYFLNPKLCYSLVGYDDKAVEFAQSAMSNLIGGIGYFHGHSIVK